MMRQTTSMGKARMKSIFRIRGVSANDLVLRQAADEVYCQKLFLLASSGIAGSRSGSVELGRGPRERRNWHQ